MEERKVLQAINLLPFVVKFKCAFQSSRNLYLVQEYYAGMFQCRDNKEHTRCDPIQICRGGFFSNFEEA